VSSLPMLAGPPQAAAEIVELLLEQTCAARA
jgi:hypothetical protein